MNTKLDVRIAKEILNLDVVETKTKRGAKFYTIGKPDYYDEQGESVLANPVPNYSGDLNLLYKIITDMRTVCNMSSYADGWIVRIAVSNGYSDKITYGSSKELPKAICMALLGRDI